MRSYVINLDRAPERLEHVTRQFAAVGTPFERIAAIDARTMSEAELTAFRAERDPNGWLPGQIGALLSHMQAWQRIAEGDETWGAIFEDDVHLHPGLSGVLMSDSWIPEQADIIRLETTRQGMRLGRADRAKPGSSFRLLPVLGGAWGTGAYIVDRSVARWFLATPARLQAPVDFLVFQQPTPVFPPGLNTLQMDPAPCVQDKYHPAIDQRLGFDSAIDGTNTIRQRMIQLAKQRFASTGRRLLGKRMVAYSGEAIPSA